MIAQIGKNRAKNKLFDKAIRHNSLKSTYIILTDYVPSQAFFETRLHSINLQFSVTHKIVVFELLCVLSLSNFFNC